MLYQLQADTGHTRIVQGWKTRTHGGAPAIPGPIRAWVRDVWLPSIPGAVSCEVSEYHPAAWGRVAGVAAPYPDRLSWATVIGEVRIISRMIRSDEDADEDEDAGPVHLGCQGAPACGAAYMGGPACRVTEQAEYVTCRRCRGQS